MDLDLVLIIAGWFAWVGVFMWIWIRFDLDRERMNLKVVTPLDSAETFSAIARLHESEIVNGALAEFGPKFLKEFYKFASGKADLIVALEGAEVVGFVLMTRDRKEFNDAYAWSSGIWAAGRLSRQLRTSVKDWLPAAELLSIAVRPDHRRKGIAKALVEYAAKSKFHATASQPEALKFYESLGGRIEHETDIGGLKSYTFEIHA